MDKRASGGSRSRLQSDSFDSMLKKVMDDVPADSTRSIAFSGGSEMATMEWEMEGGGREN